jgi:PAS domain S-box-containing protein
VSTIKPYIPPHVTRYRSEADYPEWTRSTVQLVRQSAELNSSLLTSADGHYIAVLDANRKYVQVSENFCQLLGYSHWELEEKRVDDLTAPETSDVPMVFDLFSRLGYMHGLWMLVARKGTRILIRYEAWLRPDSLIEGHMEVVGAGTDPF